MSEEKSDVFDEDNESFDLYPDENQDLTEEEKAKKKHVFSDQDQDLFLETQILEDLYDKIINKENDKSDESIQARQRENGEKYRQFLETKKSEVEQRVQQIRQEIELKLADVSSQHEEILKEIDTVYQKSFKTLLDGAFKAFGYDF